MAKKKDKVVSLASKTNSIESMEEMIEQGNDPRSQMTEEEIREFMRKEAEALDRKIGKFAAENVKPDTSELEEDEEVEEFILDLENKQVLEKPEVSSTSTIVVGEEAVAKFTQANPYTDLITSTLTSKALAKIVSDLRKEQSDIDQIEASTPELRKAFSNASQVCEKQIHEIRKAWIQGTNKIHFDRIPEWAVPKINEYIEQKLTGIIHLTTEWFDK